MEAFYSWWSRGESNPRPTRASRGSATGVVPDLVSAQNSREQDFLAQAPLSFFRDRRHSPKSIRLFVSPYAAMAAIAAEDVTALSSQCVVIVVDVCFCVRVLRGSDDLGPLFQTLRLAVETSRPQSLRFSLPCSAAVRHAPCLFWRHARLWSPAYREGVFPSPGRVPLWPASPLSGRRKGERG